MKASHVGSFVLLACLALTGSARAQASFVQAPSGQSTPVSCQSYSLAVALAFKKDPAFSIDTAADLRRVEDAIRKAIESAQGKASSVTHEHIIAGFQAYTGGRYTLKSRLVDLPTLGDLVASASGITSTTSTPLSFLLGASVRDVLLTSVSRVGSSRYSSGHIITLMGIDGPATSSRSYLVLNGGIKVGGLAEQRACEEGIPDKPSKYGASVSWVGSADIDFKPFNGKYLVWTVGG